MNGHTTMTGNTMDKLEEVRAKFQDKTAGGLEFIILEVHTDSMQVTVRGTQERYRGGGQWEVYQHNLDGVCGRGQQFSLVPTKPVIDYSRLPVDVLCKVRIGIRHRPRYSDGCGGFFPDGKDSTSATSCNHCNKRDVVKIMDNQIRANIGNTLALLPDNINLKVWTRGDNIHNGHSQTFRGWSDIIHYQILGES